MPYRVIFSPEALEQITSLYRCIAVATPPNVAERYTSAIVTSCEGLNGFPLRGASRDGIPYVPVCASQITKAEP
jgi:plasmid stabilization system protein ParE